MQSNSNFWKMINLVVISLYSAGILISIILIFYPEKHPFMTNLNREDIEILFSLHDLDEKEIDADRINKTFRYISDSKERARMQAMYGQLLQMKSEIAALDKETASMELDPGHELINKKINYLLAKVDFVASGYKESFFHMQASINFLYILTIVIATVIFGALLRNLFIKRLM